MIRKKGRATVRTLFSGNDYSPDVRAFILIPSLLIAFANAALAQWDAPLFEQDPLPDGVVSIEAERYHAKVAAGGQDWEWVANTVASGGYVMQALPNTGIINNTGYVTQSPRLDYRVNFDRTGIHYIVIRGSGATGGDDSCHAGLDGVGVATSDRIGSFNGSLNWYSKTFDGATEFARFDVPSTGEHVVNIWMREDGFVIDKFILTTNPDFIPTGLGPAASPQGDPDADADPDPHSTMITRLALNGGMIEGTFAPVPAAEGYSLLAGSDVEGGMVEDPTATVYGFQIAADPLGDGHQFFAVETVPVDATTELGSIVLNRLAYGPTPDELDRVLTGPTPIGPEAYIQEQLAPELIVDAADADPLVSGFDDLLLAERADLNALRAWYVLRAVGADRQLLEVLTQFFNNHFVTYFWKTRSWFRDQGYDNTHAYWLAAQMEYRELVKWREVLLDPNGTFYDLLKISAESPAMIIYLDTVENVKETPNENYSREIQELFCMGVDNGYDQDDIEEMSRCWTGWTLGQVHPSDLGDPHAAPFATPTVLLSQQAADWTYRKGTSEPDPDWREVTFEEGPDWSTGQTSIGFGDSDDNTDLADMRYNYSTVYLRHPFVINDVNDAPQLQLRLYVDDGCIAWINGQEVARLYVAPGSQPYNGTSSSSHEAKWEDVALPDASGYLTAGTNMLAIQVLNRTVNDGDLSMDAEVLVPGVWQFVFDDPSHDPSNKVIFLDKQVDPRFGPPYAGQSYELALPERLGTAGIDDGYDIIAHLADLPFTQEFISVKLCRLLVHDDFQIGGYFNISQLSPEAELVKSCMQAWETLGPDGRKGNIRAVLSTIVSSDLFRSQAAALHKVKTPFEFTVSALRALRGDIGGGTYASATDGYDFGTPMNYMGMGLFARSDPNGWPEEGGKWIDTSTISERLRFIQNFLMRPDDTLKDQDYGSSGDDNVCDPVALAGAHLNAVQLSDPVEVTEYFVGLLYPGAGFANLDLDLAECIALLNSDATGVPDSSPFNALTPGTQAYDERVRSLVGLLMASPRFQEQ